MTNYSSQCSAPQESVREGFPHNRIPMIFEEQARCRSSQIAVIHGGNQVTYGDLNLRVTHLASYLRTLNLGQGEIIAVCLDHRSIEEGIAALLAIAQLGCTYLPVDPSWPKAEKISQLEGSRVACILTHPEFAAHLPACPMLVYLDDDWARVIALQREMNPPNSCDPS